MIAGKVNIKSLLRDLSRFPGELDRTLQELVDSEARGLVKDAVQATPPFHAKAAPTPENPGKFETVSGVDARKAGERKIDREAKALFVGVRLKGKKTLKHLFGNQSPEVGKKPPYTFATVEQWPDVDKIWDARIAKGRRSIGRGNRAELAQKMKKTSLTRGAYYVDQRKLQATIRARKKKVGTLAAGWNAAAKRLNVRLPIWITRHGTKHGSVNVNVRRGGYSVRISNTVPYASALRLQSIADRAMKVRQGKLERRLPYVIQGAIRRASREALKAA